jgi:hypothetical protein
MKQPHLLNERGSLIKTYSNVLPRDVGVSSNGMLTSASHILYHFIALGLCFNLHTIGDGGEISSGLNFWRWSRDIFL